MAIGKGLPPAPPQMKRADDLMQPVWQRWIGSISDSIKSLVQVDQTNQFANGKQGTGCYSAPVRAAATTYNTGNSPRFVSVRFTGSAVGDGANLAVGGTVVAKHTLGAAGACSFTLSAIVPGNTDYSCNLLAAGVIDQWLEM